MLILQTSFLLFLQYIQILHIQNHWVTVSNMKVPGDGYFTECACIYDNLYHASVAANTKVQICSFVRPKAVEMRFDLMNIQPQDNLNDCGVYAIACATELTYGYDPCLAFFQPEAMRSHLTKCLESRTMLRFPLKKVRRVGFGKRVKQSVAERIYCNCRMPNYDKSLPMVMCSICSQWFHEKCIDKKN